MFGSCARGDYNEESDIDLLVLKKIYFRLKHYLKRKNSVNELKQICKMIGAYLFFFYFPILYVIIQIYILYYNFTINLFSKNESMPIIYMVDFAELYNVVQ